MAGLSGVDAINPVCLCLVPLHSLSIASRAFALHLVDSRPVKTIPPGHTFTMHLRVDGTMTASFFEVVLHPVYATFAIAQHAEYAGRQAILPFLDADEDAVGTAISLEHRASAPVGAVVEHSARVERVEGRTVTCSVRALWGDRIIAEGSTVQRVVSRERLRAGLAALGADERPNNKSTSTT